MLDELADLVRFEIRVNPPETWEKLLDGDL
jgi:hypothetical protein